MLFCTKRIALVMLFCNFMSFLFAIWICKVACKWPLNPPLTGTHQNAGIKSENQLRLSDLFCRLCSRKLKGILHLFKKSVDRRRSKNFLERVKIERCEGGRDHNKLGWEENLCVRGDICLTALDLLY